MANPAYQKLKTCRSACRSSQRSDSLPRNGPCKAFDYGTCWSESLGRVSGVKERYAFHKASGVRMKAPEAKGQPVLSGGERSQSCQAHKPVSQ